MTTFLTKAQRQILIDWYIDCLIDTRKVLTWKGVDGISSEDAQQS
jgi:hypothetical protein